MQLFRLAYKTPLVVGAGGGIGGAVVDRLAAAGAPVVLFERAEGPGAESAKATLAKIQAAGGKGIFIGCDILSDASCAAAVKAAADAGFDIDAMIYVAGVVETKGVHDSPTQAILDQVNLHVGGPDRLLKLLLPKWEVAKHGAAIIMTSIAGELPAIGKDPYNASKGAAITYAMSIAARVGHLGIRVVPFLASRVGTASALARAATSDAIAREMVSTQLSHRWITPEEIAGYMHFLLTIEARPINGDKVYCTDGALSALSARPEV